MGWIYWSRRIRGCQCVALAALGTAHPVMPATIAPHLATALLLATLGMLAPTGCKRGDHAVVAPDAPLGRVIIYRNGVAYFERNAIVEDELVLDVPGDRVDDFLKSLTIVDTATGKSLPLSYPTASTQSHGSVAMRIALPKGRREVRIAYVTESPAWKPSYRVILDRAGKARLQSWAVVDNVSNEAWRKVAVGVGSTSALSFRYDLHSVQTVERETIDTGVTLAGAPPVGGSPYSIDGANVNVLAEISDEVLASYEAQLGNSTSRGISLAGTTGVEHSYHASSESMRVVSGGWRKARRVRGKAATGTSISRNFAASVESPPNGAGGRQPGPAAAASPPSGIEDVATMLAGNSQRITIEGWAIESDGDRATAGLRRANALRDGLIARGVATDRIDVVGHTEVANADKLVKIVANQDNRPTQSRVDDDEAPRGIAHFMTASPMTIEAGHSAMVTLFDRGTDGEQVFLYDPVSDRGSKRYAFNAVRVVNPTKNTLDSGPMTVYADDQFLGEGLADPIPPGAAAVVPFGFDRTLVATPTTEMREEIESLKTIERGIATTETQRIRRTVVELANRGRQDATVYVRHHVASGWTLRNPPKDLERMGNDIVIPIRVAAGKTASLALTESTPIATAIDLRSTSGLHAVAVFLERDDIDADLRKDLEAIVAAQHDVANVDDTLATRRTHAQALRSRVNELADQLVALRKVGRAQALSGHLAKRMRTLGDRLDAAAAEISDLETRRLESGITLDNLVADLALEPPKVARKAAP